jgi:hypothetical protein
MQKMLLALALMTAASAMAGPRRGRDGKQDRNQDKKSGRVVNLPEYFGWQDALVLLGAAGAASWALQ